MTLIVSVPARDGIVLASDSQITSGQVRTTGEKLFSLNDHCAWGGAGELALIQRVEEDLGRTLVVDQPLADIRDSVAGIIKESVSQLLQLDFRTQFFNSDPDTLLSLHPGDFLFVENREGTVPRALHVLSNGTAEWIIDRPYAIGMGAPFAYALLGKYQGCDLDLERASVLAFKVIEEAIEVGSYGLGPPVSLWQLRPDGIEVLDEKRTAGLADSAKDIRELEVGLLVDGPKDAPLVEGTVRESSVGEAGLAPPTPM